jgi:hypothetical protein
MSVRRRHNYLNEPGDIQSQMSCKRQSSDRTSSEHRSEVVDQDCIDSFAYIGSVVLDVITTCSLFDEIKQLRSSDEIKSAPLGLPTRHPRHPINHHIYHGNEYCNNFVNPLYASEAEWKNRVSSKNVFDCKNGGDVLDLLGEMIRYCRDNHWRTNPVVLEGYKVSAFPSRQEGDSLQSIHGVIVNPLGRREYSTVRCLIAPVASDANRDSVVTECNLREPFMICHQQDGSLWLEPDSVCNQELSKIITRHVLKKFWKMVKMVVETKDMLRPFLSLLREIINPDENPICSQGKLVPLSKAPTSKQVDMNGELYEVLVLLSRPEYKVLWNKDASGVFKPEWFSTLFLHNVTMH